jgi:hypothetical protein
MSALYLSTVREGLVASKQQAEKAIGQVDDAALHRTIDPESNSIAVLMRHMAGNMRSRFTDFLTTDGEKPDRNRDGEFETTAFSRDQLMADWESGWASVLAAVDALTPADLDRTVLIRAEPHTVYRALDRAVRHYASHIGQIVLLAKHFAGDDWKTLSIPKTRK